MCGIQEGISVLNFEEQAILLLGKDRVLGKATYKAIEDVYNGKPENNVKMEFIFNEEEKAPTEEVIKNFPENAILTLIPSQMKFTTSEVTTQGILKKNEVRSITINDQVIIVSFTNLPY